MTSLPLRWRLTLWYAAALFLMVALFALLVDTFMHQRLIARSDLELDEELTELALEVELGTSREHLLQQLTLRFSEHKYFESSVTDEQGARWFASRRLSSISLPTPVNQSSARTAFNYALLPGLGDCRLATRQVSAPLGRLTIVSVLPLERYLAELYELRLLMLGVGAAMLLPAIVGGAALAARALRPLQDMSRAAGQITAARLEERLTHSGSADELDQLATTFNEMLDRLQFAFEELRQFTADAAHELRTPLAVIRSTAEVALNADRSIAQYQEALQSIAEETVRLTQLANQLLVLAREEAGLQHQGTEPLNLGQLIEAVMTDLEPLADEKSLGWTSTLAAEVVLDGDPARLRRVLINVLDNAVKFTPEGGAVTVTMRQHDDLATVVVRDTGPGIAAEHLPKIGQRFYRPDASRSRETGGAGLGLAISRAIVEGQGGRFWLHSALGQGTEVHIVLPSGADEQPAGLRQ